MLYAVEYSGPFGFMKPWTSVRDGKTNSQQFIIPSTLEGMRQKLGVAAILRHKLQHSSLTWQQEVTHPRDWQPSGKTLTRPRAVLERGLLLRPVLILALATADDAARALRQHICLSRNEDLLLPGPEVRQFTDEEFSALPGAELLRSAANEPGAFLVGHDRYDNNQPMYGVLSITRPASSTPLAFL